MITNFNAGQTMTFPLFIYGAARQGVPPEVNVLATGMLLVVLILMVVNVLVQRRLARRDFDAGAPEARGGARRACARHAGGGLMATAVPPADGTAGRPASARSRATRA